MDIFAHGLWTGAAYKAASRKTGKSFNMWLAVFLGVLPDLFAFTPMFLWMFWGQLTGDPAIPYFPRPETIEPAVIDGLPMFRLAHALYNISHSAIVFLVIFGLVYALFRRPVWELGALLLHIFIDVPTHTYRFFPTPVLWPISEWKFDGLPWGTPWFMAVNYSAIVLVYFLFWRKRRSSG